MGNAIKVGAPLVVKGIKEVQKQAGRQETLRQLGNYILFSLIIDIITAIGFFVWALLNTVSNHYLDVGLIIFPVIFVFTYCLCCCLRSENDRNSDPGFYLFVFYVWIIPHVILICAYLVAIGSAVFNNDDKSGKITLIEFYYLCMSILYGCFTYFFGSVVLEYRQVLTEWLVWNLLPQPSQVQSQL